jgi:hypothetical protein
MIDTRRALANIPQQRYNSNGHALGVDDDPQVEYSCYQFHSQSGSL